MVVVAVVQMQTALMGLEQMADQAVVAVRAQQQELGELEILHQRLQAKEITEPLEVVARTVVEVEVEQERLEIQMGRQPVVMALFLVFLALQ